MNIPAYTPQPTPSSTPKPKSSPSKLKIIIPVAVAILAVLLVAVYFLFIHKSDSRLMAEELAPYLPQYTEKEIEDVLNKELTPEQKEFVENTDTEFISELPEVDEIIETNAEAGYVSFYGTDGKRYTVTDPYGYSSMTNEELMAELDKSEERRNQILAGELTPEEVEYDMLAKDPTLSDDDLPGYEEAPITPITDEELADMGVSVPGINYPASDQTDTSHIEPGSSEEYNPADHVNGTAGSIDSNAG